MRFLSGDSLKEWCRWMAWIANCYNTTFHSSLQTSPYQVLYGKAPLSLLSYVAGTANLPEVDQLLLDLDSLLAVVKFHLMQDQERMKMNYDKKRRELIFFRRRYGLSETKTIQATFNFISICT